MDSCSLSKSPFFCRTLAMDGINSSRYAYLLNTAGRIQADLFIYTHELNDLFLDVDGTLL